MRLTDYTKAVVAVLAAALSALAASMPDGKVTGAEWMMVAVAVLGAVGVWLAPNTTPGSDGEDSSTEGRHRM